MYLAPDKCYRYLSEKHTGRQDHKLSLFTVSLYSLSLFSLAQSLTVDTVFLYQLPPAVVLYPLKFPLKKTAAFRSIFTKAEECNYLLVIWEGLAAYSGSTVA